MADRQHDGHPRRFYNVGDSIYSNSLLLNGDGTVSPPPGAGHGFAPNYEFLEQYRKYEPEQRRIFS